MLSYLLLVLLSFYAGGAVSRYYTLKTLRYRIGLLWWFPIYLLNALSWPYSLYRDSRDERLKRPPKF